EAQVGENESKNEGAELPTPHGSLLPSNRGPLLSDVTPLLQQRRDRGQQPRPSKDKSK
ncbi:unnamed protein product, partial [Ilex paraguariensis]